MKNILQILRNVNSRRSTFYIFTFLIFCTMFILNLLTYYTTDDYSYMYSFASGERIKNIFEIFPSMYVHAQTVNGRIVAHFFVQLFLMLPPVCFDLINALIYTIFIVLIYKYAVRGQGLNSIFLLLIASIIWCVTPAFGQDCLWLDGACNYLWGNTVVLAYIYPFVNLLKGRVIFKNNKICGIIYGILGAFVGAWLESASFVGIFISLISVASYYSRFKRIPIWSFISICFMICGWILMLTAPGTISNKVGSVSIKSYFLNTYTDTRKYLSVFSELIIVLVILVLFSLHNIKKDKMKLLYPLLFLISSLIANYIHVAAKGYPDRSMFSSVILLTITVASLLYDLIKENKYYVLIYNMGIFILFAGIIQFYKGTTDIFNTYVACMERESIIKKETEAGKENLMVPVINAKTKYSAKYGLVDIYSDDTNSNLNQFMAEYYGVETIIGVEY
ncbi:MAG: DUF6056 family protein [Clostridiales bacterium]|nr:DUF6056 family protein [Clostridiales bacterium]